MTTEFENQSSDLRKKAEIRLQSFGPADLESLSPEKIRTLIYEYQVHQIELELQNEELRHTQKQLEITRDRFARLFNDAPLGYLTLDSAGVIAQTNQAFAGMVDLDISQLSGRALGDFLFPEDRHAFHGRYRAFFKNPANKQLTFRLQGAGRVLDVRCVGRIETGNVFHQTTPVTPQLLLILTDISDQVHAEQVLKERERFLSIILETTQDGFWVINTKGRFTEINDAYCRMSGYTREELTEMGISDIDILEDPQETLSRIKRIIANGSELFETRHRKKDGKFFDVEVSTSYIEARGGNIVCFCRDITERKKAEAKIRHIQKTESLSRMAGAVAHHFNNQLSVVMGNLDLALDELPPDAPVREKLRQSMTAVHHATDVSRQMLSYLGQMSGIPSALDLSEVCRDVLPLIRAAIPRHIVLSADLPDAGPVVHGIGPQIQQVVSNLVTNAWEAVSDGAGTICVTLTTVRDQEIPASGRMPLYWHPKDKAYACLMVSDDGCGVPDVDIEKLFEPFFTTKFTGRGLGLPVALGIVKAHGGCLTVSGGSDFRGSVFRVYLPVSVNEASEDEEKPARPVQKLEIAGTVLLAEDEPMVREMVKTMLVRIGFRVLEAADGVEALDIFRAQGDDICCVLSDLTMPRMNGWETLSALRQIRPDLPVILTSGYDRKQVMTGTHPEVPQAFLHKPFSMADLKNALSISLSA